MRNISEVNIINHLLSSKLIYYFFSSSGLSFIPKNFLSSGIVQSVHIIRSTKFTSLPLLG